MPGSLVTGNPHRACGIVEDMTLQGEYVPSKAQWVRDQVAKFEATDGREANTLRDTGDPIVVITSVGAKSGNLRKNPVMRVERDGIYVAIASKGGADDQPEWYYNFVAHPEVELQDGAVRKTYRAELVEGAEREDLWALAVDTWATYASYQEKTERQIPVFKLTPLE
jgi:deazaflavin-dependent oxidoreductase (nitroreductase family)